MPGYRFTPKERCELLAAAVCDYLNESYSESELELDQEKANLYNLAAAVLERDIGNSTHSGGTGGDEHLDRELLEWVEAAGEGDMVHRAWQAMKQQIGEAV